MIHDHGQTLEFVGTVVNNISISIQVISINGKQRLEEISGYDNYQTQKKSFTHTLTGCATLAVTVANKCF